ncbi:replication-relaxation family protein [Dactylosporangium sp. McL0621]|uniref:replication-relaxation family protein n=1 Tax=Dactylosporangium sp. McL0621 TaxID=3415678 RepID=UPI003CF34ED0
MTRTNADRVLAALAFCTERDLQVFEWLYDHQVLTIGQIAAMVFNSRSAAQERLLRLYRLGMLERFRLLQSPQVGWHYVLDRLGTEVIAARRGDPTPRPSTVAEQRRRIATNRQLQHTLGVNQFFADLIVYARHHDNAALLRWWSEVQCCEPLRFGAVSMHRVRADGHGVFVEGKRRVAFFLEYDRGTESLSVLADKADRYGELVAQGGPAWPVLFFLPDRTREDGLHHLLRRRPPTTPVATAVRNELAAQQTVADSVWRPVGNAEHRHRLVALGALGDRPDERALSRLDRRPTW